MSLTGVCPVWGRGLRRGVAGWAHGLAGTPFCLSAQGTGAQRPSAPSARTRDAWTPGAQGWPPGLPEREARALPHPAEPAAPLPHPAEPAARARTFSTSSWFLRYSACFSSIHFMSLNMEREGR